MSFKAPVSVLVVIHTPGWQVLLLERSIREGLWQSVTGSREATETLRETAIREVGEETGLTRLADDFLDWRISNRFEIFAEWRYRYSPGVTHNTEYVFSLAVPERCPITLSPEEHRNSLWLPWREAAARCFSWTNRDAILMLPAMFQRLSPAQD